MSDERVPPLSTGATGRQVEVIRSERRRRTAQATIEGGAIRVRVPAGMDPAEEHACVIELVERLERRSRAEGVDLRRRADDLARRYDLPSPRRIRWVDNQRSRWGSCTPSTGDIRISSRLASYPQWVIDYVVVHELAHLVVADHSPRFHSLVDRYPRAERARGYLLAKDTDGDDAGDEVPGLDADVDG